MDKVTPADDAKLQHLKAQLRRRLTNPINPGNRKVLIFTAFADTADYLYAHLAPHVCASTTCTRAKVTGTDGPKIHPDEALRLPNRADPVLAARPRRRLAVCRRAQRDRRADRHRLHLRRPEPAGLRLRHQLRHPLEPGAHHPALRPHGPHRLAQRPIQLVNYWPDISLDEYINLKERVENRMMIADVTATGDDNVLSAKANDIAYRKEQLRRLQEEVIELEDVKTGVSITDLGLNDFRMDLAELRQGTWRAGHAPQAACTPSCRQIPSWACSPGVIFTLRNLQRRRERSTATTACTPTISSTSATRARSSPTTPRSSACSTWCAAAARPQANPSPNLQAFNREQRRPPDAGVFRPAGRAIRSMIEVKEEKDIDSLFTAGRTTALTHTIAGLDDFELIAFLVIQEH